MILAPPFIAIGSINKNAHSSAVREHACGHDTGHIPGGDLKLISGAELGRFKSCVPVSCDRCSTVYVSAINALLPHRLSDAKDEECPSLTIHTGEDSVSFNRTFCFVANGLC